MLALETVVKIRNDHFRDKVPIKAIARKRRVSRNTVRDGPEAFGSAGKRQPKQGLGSGSMIERSRSGRKTLPAELGSQPNRLIKRLSEGGSGVAFPLSSGGTEMSKMPNMETGLRRRRWGIVRGVPSRQHSGNCTTESIFVTNKVTILYASTLCDACADSRFST